MKKAWASVCWIWLQLKVNSHYDSQLCYIDFSGLEFSLDIVVMVICRSVELFIPKQLATAIILYLSCLNTHFFNSLCHF